MVDTSNIEALLNNQLDQLNQLHAILLTENDVLKQQKNTDDLTAVTQQKHELLKAIEAADKTLANDQSFISLRKSGAFEEQMAAITGVLEKCKEQNQINGHIIQQSSLAVERMKTSLLENHNRSSMTYDNKGKKSGALSSLDIKA